MIKSVYCASESSKEEDIAIQKGWSEAVTLGTGEVICVCGACDVSIRKALNAWNEGEPYHLKWLSSKSSCCVPACTSTIRVDKHNYSWEMICQSIGIASISGT